jgi:hypothetical protein
MMWSIEEAISIINKINAVCKKNGYFPCLYGSIILNGKSDNDLDIQLISFLGIDNTDSVLRDILIRIDGDSVSNVYFGLLHTKAYLIKLKDGKIIDLVIRIDKPLSGKEW